MQYPALVQLLRLTKTNGGEVWINPAQIVYAEVAKKKEPEEAAPKQKTAGKKDDGFMTILHVTGKEGKVFVNESPAEINRIIKSVKRNLKMEYQYQ